METPRPQFSIITANLNSGEKLEVCCRSLLEQRFVDWEQIVVDGKSEDQSAAFIKTLGDRRIRLIEESDEGIADALNKGLKIARGNWILIVHSDDRLNGRDILIEVNQLLQESDDIYAFSVLLHEGTVQHLLKPRHSRGPFQLKQPYPHQGMVVSRRAYESVGFFDLNYRIAFDFDWIRRAELAGIRFRIRAKVIAIMESGGISTRKDWVSRKIRFDEEQRVRVQHSSGFSLLYWKVIYPVYLFYRIILQMIKK